ncbi:MAG: alpha/beta fold hydrolase [Reyranellaceae bacterium]
MAGSIAWNESSIAVAGVKLHLTRAGKGRPLLVLHHDTGTLPRLPFYDSLAERFDVLVPHHPGYGRSQRPDWLRHPRDIAVMYRALLAELDLASPVLVGLGLGGWIAAEMATMAPRDVGALALVGAMGVKPPQGEILDQALLSYMDYVKAGFHQQAAMDAVYGAEPSTDQLVEWDVCREMSFRIAWKPYMYSQTLPHLLGGVKAKAIVVHGDDDRVVPPSAAEVYAKGLANAKLEIVKDCGHYVEMEKPGDLTALVMALAGGN